MALNAPPRVLFKRYNGYGDYNPNLLPVSSRMIVRDSPTHDQGRPGSRGTAQLVSSTEPVQASLRQVSEVPRQRIGDYAPDPQRYAAPHWGEGSFSVWPYESGAELFARHLLEPLRGWRAPSSSPPKDSHSASSCLDCLESDNRDPTPRKIVQLWAFQRGIARAILPQTWRTSLARQLLRPWVSPLSSFSCSRKSTQCKDDPQRQTVPQGREPTNHCPSLPPRIDESALA